MIKHTSEAKSHLPQKMNLRIRVLHTVDYPEIAKVFRKKHEEVLNEFGLLDDIDSSKGAWWENTCSYIFIVEDCETGEIGGGIRLDVIDETHEIPLESALGQLSPDISERVHKYNYVLGELCGLWMSKKFSERRLPLHLVRSVLAVTTKLRVKHLVTMLPKHTKGLFAKIGFQVVDTLGEDGCFSYPNEKYVSTVMELEDSYALNTIEEEERDFIVWLRSHPKQPFFEESKNLETEIEYDLRIM